MKGLGNLNLTGKVIVVTGAGSGQGAGEALYLAEKGAVVIATDISPEPAWLSEAPSNLEYHRLDVASEAEWARLAEHLSRTHNLVHGFVNNAGITNRARLNEIDVKGFQKVMDVNLVGGLLGIQTLSPFMKEGGSIVLVGSLASMTGHFPVAYTVSKWAVRGLARVASLELGSQGIRVNVIHPGFIKTPMTDSAPKAYLKHNLDENPLGRLGEVADVSPMVAFLLSDDSSYISGAEIPIDGGQSAHGGMKKLSDMAREDS
jgi:3alpha(or 20beta)-hydroxysteroid dehydrogenase